MSLASHYAISPQYTDTPTKFLLAGYIELRSLEQLANQKHTPNDTAIADLTKHMVAILDCLLRWRYQPMCRSRNWENTIKSERNSISRKILLQIDLVKIVLNPDWQATVWRQAITAVKQETGIAELPKNCPWTMEQILDRDWVPEVR